MLDSSRVLTLGRSWAEEGITEGLTIPFAVSSVSVVGIEATYSRSAALAVLPLIVSPPLPSLGPPRRVRLELGSAGCGEYGPFLLGQPFRVLAFSRSALSLFLDSSSMSVVAVVLFVLLFLFGHYCCHPHPRHLRCTTTTAFTSAWLISHSTGHALRRGCVTVAVAVAFLTASAILRGDEREDSSSRLESRCPWSSSSESFLSSELRSERSLELLLAPPLPPLPSPARETPRERSTASRNVSSLTARCRNTRPPSPYGKRLTSPRYTNDLALESSLSSILHL